MIDDFEVIQDPKVEESLKETISVGESFEVLVNLPAGAHIRAFVENSIQSFANRAIKDGFKDFNEYQLERGKVLGLSALISEIDNSIRVLNEQRSKTAKSTKQ